MQAIVTKFIPATNYRGSRVKAKADAGSLTLTWDDALDIDENHDAAARALCVKLGWVFVRLVRGGLPRGMGGNAYVMLPGAAPPIAGEVKGAQPRSKKKRGSWVKAMHETRRTKQERHALSIEPLAPEADTRIPQGLDKRR